VVAKPDNTRKKLKQDEHTENNKRKKEKKRESWLSENKDWRKHVNGRPKPAAGYLINSTYRYVRQKKKAEGEKRKRGPYVKATKQQEGGVAQDVNAELGGKRPNRRQCGKRFASGRGAA